MDNVSSFLSAISIYPIPATTLHEIAVGRGLDLDGDSDTIITNREAYQLAKADVLRWLSSAPNVSQGGVSYSFSEFERAEFRRQADAIYTEYGEKKSRYGYKGSRI